jgi:serine/threonine protein kinase
VRSTSVFDRYLRSKELQNFAHVETIHVLEKIGEGVTSDVYFGKWGTAHVAFKKSKTESDILRDEVVALKNLSACPHVIRLEGVIDTPHCLILALEHMPNGTLLQLLSKSRSSLRDERLTMRILADVCSALVFVHAHGYIHADVAARNVMISADWRGRLCDFGSSIALKPNEHHRYVGAAGPIRWLPPESIISNMYSSATDMYAFGVTIWETVCQRTPWEGLSLQEIVIHVSSGKTLAIPETVSEIFASLMRSCFTFDADSRADAMQVHDQMVSFFM